MLNVVFIGIAEGAGKEATRGLAKLFNLSEQRIEKLLETTPLVLKRGLSADEARRYEEAIIGAGGVCTIEREILDVDLPPEQVPSIAIPAAEALDSHAHRIAGRSASEIKRLFIYGYIERAFKRISGECTESVSYEDVEEFRDGMDDVAFWTRCAFFANDPELAHALGPQASSTLQKMAGRILSPSVRRIVGHLDADEEPDVDSLGEDLALLRERYEFGDDPLVNMACSVAAKWKKLSMGEREQLVKKFHSAYSDLIRTQDAGGERYQKTAVTNERSATAPDNPATQTGSRTIKDTFIGCLVLLPLLSAGIAYGCSWFISLYYGIFLGVLVSSMIYLLIMWKEHSEKRVVIFDDDTDARVTLAGGLLFLIVTITTAILSKLWVSLTAALGLFFLLRFMLARSARANESVAGFLASALAKACMWVLSLLAFLVYMAMTSNRSRYDDESKAEYEQYVRQTELKSMVLAGVTTIALAGSAAAITRESGSVKPRTHRHVSWVYGLATFFSVAYAIAMIGPFPQQSYEAARPPASDAVVHPTAQQVALPAKVQTLIKEYKNLDEKCRGGSGDLAETRSSCVARNETYKLIAGTGWCWGPQDEVEATKDWTRCEAPPSPEAASPAAAASPSDREAAATQKYLEMVRSAAAINATQGFPGLIKKSEECWKQPGNAARKLDCVAADIASRQVLIAAGQSEPVGPFSSDGVFDSAKTAAGPGALSSDLDQMIASLNQIMKNLLGH